MPVSPYLFFNGRCEEAIAFYQKALGLKLEEMMRFKDNPDLKSGEPSMCMPGAENKIMHACLRIGDTILMASDGMSQDKPEFKGFSLTINAKDAAEADRLFGALAEDGQVQMPLGKTFFSPRFGAVADKFGVSWMVIVLPQEAMAAA
jgi:PhnB protein